MSCKKFESEDELRQAVLENLDAGPLPPEAQAKLDAVYASLGSIPQDRPTPEGAAVPPWPRPAWSSSSSRRSKPPRPPPAPCPAPPPSECAADESSR